MIEAVPAFIWLALAGGCSVALVSGPLGAFVMWRKMAYFGDTLAHGALLGIAVGLALEVNISATIIAVSLLVAVTLWGLQKSKRFATDTLLGILSHSTLAMGLVGIGLLQDLRIDLMAFLFGDLLTINLQDIYLFAAISLAVLVSLALCWQPLLMTTIDENLAKAEGVRTDLLELLLLLLVALVIAVAMRVVGVLLITALLIIPAAAARPLSRNPEPMVVLASLMGMTSVVLGLGASYMLDIAAGPAVVLAALMLFLLAQVFGRYVLDRETK